MYDVLLRWRLNSIFQVTFDFTVLEYHVFERFMVNFIMSLPLVRVNFFLVSNLRKILENLGKIYNFYGKSINRFPLVNIFEILFKKDSPWPTKNWPIRTHLQKTTPFWPRVLLKLVKFFKNFELSTTYCTKK